MISGRIRKSKIKLRSGSETLIYILRYRIDRGDSSEPLKEFQPTFDFFIRDQLYTTTVQPRSPANLYYASCYQKLTDCLDTQYNNPLEFATEMLYIFCYIHKEINTYIFMVREAAKKRSFFSGPATKRGGGVSALSLRKNTVFKALKKFLKIYCGH